MKNKVAAGIVLYNPNIERLIKNIESVCVQVDKIIIFDNGSNNRKKIIEVLKKYPNIVEIYSASNKGIAHALNQIASKALEMDYQWLLTLDQDTVVSKNLVSTYIQHINLPQLGQLCCGYEDANLPGSKMGINTNVPKYKIHKVKECITSGTLINLKALRNVGGFDEDLFIDGVDDEISYLLRNKKYYTYKVNFIGMSHELGKIDKGKIFNKEIKHSNYGPMRRYYIARNRIILSKRYKNYQPLTNNLIFQLKDWITIILFEQNKKKKSWAILKGISDVFKYKKARRKYL